MRALFDLAHCTDPQCLKRLVIEFPAVVIPDGTILPDHKIKVGLLLNFLVSPAIPEVRTQAEGPPNLPPPPSERSAPLRYAEQSLGPRLQDLHRFHGLRREEPGSAPSPCLTTRAQSHIDSVFSNRRRTYRAASAW